MNSLARVAITKYHRLEDLTEISFLTVLEARSRYWQVFDSPEDSLLGFKKAAFSLCPHMDVPRGMGTPSVPLGVKISPSCKNTSHIG